MVIHVKRANKPKVVVYTGIIAHPWLTAGLEWVMQDQKNPHKPVDLHKQYRMQLTMGNAGLGKHSGKPMQAQHRHPMPQTHTL